MDAKEYLEIVERTLDEVLPRLEDRPSDLSGAMRYAVGTGGKRIRPLVCMASAVAAGGVAEDARFPAAAIELLHNYTLVHDDLPAMDNDVERRGKPTVWKKFGRRTRFSPETLFLRLPIALQRVHRATLPR